MLATLRQGFLLLDSDLTIRDYNEKLIEFVGLPSVLVKRGSSLSELAKAAVAKGVLTARTARAMFAPIDGQLGDSEPRRRLCRLANGRTLEISMASFGGAGWILTYEDVSAQVSTELALAEQNERFDAAMRNIPIGVCMFDADRRLIICNTGYQELYGLPPELTKASTHLQQILDFRDAVGNSPRDMSTYFDVVDEAKAAHITKSRRIELQDGRTVRIAHNPMSGGEYVAIHEDITETVRAEEQIQFLASHDGLTRLPNRTLLREHIGDAITRTRRGGLFCLLFIDLDNFKSVNDMHGHPIGDMLLKDAALRLKSCLQETDVLARVGGDEFVVLQTNIEAAEEADALARQLVDEMAKPFDLEGRSAFLGVSVGITVWPGDGDDVDALLKNADLAMYRSKTEGRNTYRFFELAMDARLQERRLLETDLRRAIANGEFELYYQPQVDAHTEVVTGCEALIRWNHPARGMVSPIEFIPIAEETGMIVPLGAWVIQQACRDAATWPKHIGVAVNLSSAQFKGVSLIQTVTSALNESGLLPNRLELEITETALLTENDQTISTLKLLRTLGVRIALDDFGTGYSSLSYLRSFPFDKIKIDRSFIKDLGSKNDCLAIIKAVASLGAALGMATTAEGVETVEQLQHIRDQGCTEVQGYFFGRPCPASVLTTFFNGEQSLSLLSNTRRG